MSALGFEGSTGVCQMAKQSTGIPERGNKIETDLKQHGSLWKLQHCWSIKPKKVESREAELKWKQNEEICVPGKGPGTLICPRGFTAAAFESRATSQTLCLSELS